MPCIILVQFLRMKRNYLILMDEIMYGISLKKGLPVPFSLKNIVYRVSHSKVCKVNCFWWGCTFDFFLVWEVLCVPKKLPIKPVFIESMLCAIYGPICKLANFCLGKKSLNAPNVKLLSNIFYQRFLIILILFCFQPVI